MLVILSCAFPVGDICAVGSIPEGPGMTCFPLAGGGSVSLPWDISRMQWMYLRQHLETIHGINKKKTPNINIILSPT